MSALCGKYGSFWDSNLTWYTDYPNFTPCFEQTLLTWIPSGFLWLFSTFQLISLFRVPTSRLHILPTSPLIILKSIGSLSLIIVHLTNLSFNSQYQNEINTSPANRYSSIIKICTYLLSFFLLLVHKTKGIRTSGVLFTFWLLTCLCEAFPFQSVFRQDNPKNLHLYIQLINFPIVVSMLILNCWADKAPHQHSAISLKRPVSSNHKENGIPLISPITNLTPPPPNRKIPCPEADSSYLSKLIFFWFESLAWKGWKNPLIYEDLWDLNEQDLSQNQYPLFAKNWKKAESQAKINGKPVSVLKVLVTTFGPQFFIAACLKFVQDCLTFVPPRILRLLIGHVGNSKDEENWKGYLYVAILLATSLIQTIILAQYFHRIFVIGMRIRTSLSSAIYRKALKISNSAKKETSSGEVVNLMSVDSQRLMDLVTYLNMVWSSPFQVIVAFCFLWETLGPSVLAGVSVMVLMVPLNGWLVGRVKGFNIQLMENKDGRVKLISEILSGIKVIKLYAWEPSFKDQVLKIRGQEIKVLRKAECFDAVTTFIWMCAPVIVSLVTFATYVLVDEKNVLDSSKAFVALNLFDIMSIPLVLLPMSMLMIAESSVSLKRLGKYLNAEEIDENAVEHQSNEDYPLVVENGQFAWDSNTNSFPPTLTNINLKVKRGSLVAIVGTVGSGKSSLLSAILGEMIKISGHISVTKGNIAYVAQQAWIRNLSLKDNILFGQQLNTRKYNRIINCCALAPDLEVLPSGDQTEIGEKGVNLSGGQKQRVSLARAVYSDVDLYLLDDPLSAVDSHVGRHIFDKVLGQEGILREKTRVLVTHGVTYLPQVDHIIVLKNGQVSEEGTYKELLERKGAFSEFLQQHTSSKDDTKGDDDKLVLELETQERRRTMSISSNKTDDITPAKKLIEVEKAETGSVKGDVYMHYFKVIGGPMIVATLVSHLVSQGLQIGGNIWLSKWSAEKTREDGTIDPDKRNIYLWIYAAFGAGQSIAVVVGAIVVAMSMLKASAKMHTSMLINILKSPSAFFDTTPLGRIVNRFAKDVDIVDKQLPLNLKQWLRCLFQVVGIILVISYSTPIFLAVIVPLGIVYLLVQRFYVATSRQLKRLESVSRSPIYSHFSETLAGTSTIRAYSKQLPFILESEAKVDYNQRAYFPSIVANRWLAVRLETVGNLIIFFAGLFAVLGRDELDAGTVGLSVSYALTITQTLNWLVRMTSDVETNIVAVERLKEYSEIPQEAEWENAESKPNSNWPQNGMITFDRYQTRYRPGLDLVLRNVTCQIQPGEKIGIVGRTGAGKSSLTLALFRLVEATSGKIIIDGENIGQLGLHDLRTKLTIIPQEPVLFSGTLRFNLDPFGRHSDHQIWTVLGLAHLKNFVSGLTAGLGHTISEGGENLSVGQRQLVCLARALLRKTKILVLDEATAAVDLETDDLIQTTIRSAFKECTVLTIAHRLNTIMDCMRVMVLDKGEIKEFDSPASLLENRKSIFYGMAKDAGIVS